MTYVADQLSETNRKGASRLPLLILKNLLFWGAIGLMGYALFLVASLLIG